MVMYDSIVLNDVDITSYRIKWVELEEWDKVIDMFAIECSPNIVDALTLAVGQSITAQRGLSGSKDEYVFRGQVTQVQPSSSGVKLICKSPLIDAIKEGRTKSWDKDIDTEAGVGSEIFKDICDNSEINYTTASITSTGSGSADAIRKVVQNDEDDFQIMNELAEHYDYTITYDYDNDIVEFRPKGFVTYPVSLTVGADIRTQIDWKTNMEQMQNKIKVVGATVYDKVEESFAGPATSFTLQKTPEDTEVRDTNAAGSVYIRGQKDLGTIGTDFDYYVDVEQKKLVFGSSTANVWIRYGAQVPMPIIVKNQTSIDAYGGPNKKPHFKKYTFNDIKDVADAEDRANALLQKYGTPFVEAHDLKIHDDIISANGNIKPGNVITIIDNFNTGFENTTVFVKSVKKKFPHTYDEITVGDEIWRTEDWQGDLLKKVNRLLNELNKNQDILIHRFDLSRVAYHQRRYTEKIKKDRSGEGVNTFILGHYTFGILGTQELGDAGATWTTTQMQQGNNKYREFLYDTKFQDSGSTTGTWDTTNKEITLEVGDIVETSEIALGTTYDKYTVSSDNITESGDGSILVEISGDGKTNYESVTLDTRTDFTNSSGSGVHIRFTSVGNTFGATGLAFPIGFGGTITIANGYNQDGSYDIDEPAIFCFLEE